MSRIFLHSSDLRDLRDNVNELRGLHRFIEQKRVVEKSKFLTLQIRSENIAKAQFVIQEVAKKTQQKLEYKISDLVSMAEAAVFEDPYEFVARFSSRGDKRRTTECKLLFKRRGEEMEPRDASGGGTVDVAALALRVTFLIMENPKSRRVLILDEPFGFISPDLQAKCSWMLKQLSERLNLQVICISHRKDMIDAADKVFLVELDAEGESHVSAIVTVGGENGKAQSSQKSTLLSIDEEEKRPRRRRRI